MKYTINHVYPFLLKLYGVEPQNITPVGVGEWSQAFFYKLGPHSKVIRFSATADDFKRDIIASRFNSPALPVPPLEHFGPAFDGFFAVSPRVEGEMVDRLSRAQMLNSIASIIRLFDALRQADSSSSKGFGGWDTTGNGTRASWHDFLLNLGADSPSSRISSWRQKLKHKPDALNLINKATARVATLVPLCPNIRHLVHNDLLHFNLIINAGAVAGVIDWGCALWGDYLYDLAMFVAWQFYYPALKGIDIKSKTKVFLARAGADLTNFDKRLECYQIHLLLDSLAFTSFKDHWVDFKLAQSRLARLLDS
ncbi:MAG: aminoglycoside phosphotransferase family protein [Candidatus Shapirobacteria bacterium]